jgi:hypothetical protein
MTVKVDFKPEEKVFAILFKVAKTHGDKHFFGGRKNL